MNKPSQYVVELFHKLREDISGIKHRLFTEKPKLEPGNTSSHEYTINAVHKDRDTKKENENSVRATLNLPEAIRVEATTEERQKEWKNDRTFLLSLFGVGFAGIVAVIYFGQWLTMNRQIRQDQRPWIRITVKKPGTMGLNATFNGMLEVVDYGKTPARDIRIDTAVKEVPRNETPDLTFGPSVGLHAKTGMAYPQIPLEEGIPFGLLNTAEPPRFRTVQPYEFQRFNNGQIYLVVYARVRYGDAFGVEHWTQFCEWIVSNAQTETPVQAAPCTAYNDIDTD